MVTFKMWRTWFLFQAFIQICSSQVWYRGLSSVLQCHETHEDGVSSGFYSVKQTIAFACATLWIGYVYCNELFVRSNTSSYPITAGGVRKNLDFTRIDLSPLRGDLGNIGVKYSYSETEITPIGDGKSSLLFNGTLREVPNLGFDLQIAVEVADLGINATSAQQSPPTNGTSKKVSAQQVQCPTSFIDVVLQYFTLTLSDSQAFQTNELPPFLQPRFSGGPGNAVVREYIKATYNGLGWTVEEDASVKFTPLGFLPFTNVITTWNPQYAKRLVLACHYDSKFLPVGFIGAIDAAVPCALLVDLAKRLTPLFRWAAAPVSIQMIFFDGGEPYVNFSPTDSLYGSKNLAAVWASTLDPLDPTKNKLGNIDHFILLNTFGHEGTQFERFYQETDDLYTSFLALEICLALKGLGVRPLPLTRLLFGNTRRSFEVYDDQVPFRQAGVQNVLHVVSSPFPPEWHTLGDNFNFLNFPVIEDINRIFRVFIANYYISQSLAQIF